MRKTPSGKWILSPSDLINFLGCQHSIFLEINRSKNHVGSSKEPSGSETLFQEMGSKHEENYLSKLRLEGRSIVEIPKPSKKGAPAGKYDEEFARRVALTKQAMSDGADVIYQAALQSRNWAGYADFLIKDSGKSSLGNHHYQVIDTKLSTHAEAKHIVQLIVYGKLLKECQGIEPSTVSLVLGNNLQEPFLVSKFDSYVSRAMARFENFLAEPPKASSPERCTHCSQCKWKDHCEDQWVNENSLTLVANITKLQIRKLKTKGVATVESLATLKTGKTDEELEIAKPVLQRLVSQASLQEHKRLTGKNKYKLLKQEQGKGFARLPETNSADLFFDMEGDPLYPGGLEYLFGVAFTQGRKEVFKSIWAHNEEEEALAVANLMDFFLDHLQKNPKAHIYHYNHYEVTALARLTAKHAHREMELRELLRANRFVDLYTVVRESLQTSEPGYSLKNLEVFFPPECRDGDVATAMDSIVVYNQWRENNNPGLLASIEKYNRIDCESTTKLRNWLFTIKPSEMEWLVEMPDDQGKSSESDRKENAEYLSTKALCEKQKDLSTDHCRAIVDLLEFHRRESDCKWREIISRQSKTTQELLNDLDCLAGLSKLGQPKEGANSSVQTYEFFQQDSKIEEGKTVVDVSNHKIRWLVRSIDYLQKRIDLASTGKQKGPFPEKISIGLGHDVSDKVLRESIYRYARDLIDGKFSHPCIDDILCRRKARFQKQIRSSNKSPRPLNLIENLDRSYLIIQGPPGTGKTTTSAEIILNLVAKNKKVGIAANSHKVILNLLHKVAELAERDGVRLSGFKVSSSKNSDQYFDVTLPGGSLIENVGKLTDKQRQMGNLFAGTAFFFANAANEQLVDYLFIDEAGQVSLANVVAMGHATKNLILVGDQMQLGQPTQAVHPGESGLSVLAYLLQDENTVGADRGVFLETTHRLHPKICGYISEAFYNSKLRPDPKTEKFRLNFQPRIPGIEENGVYFAPIPHEDCSQKCEPEALAIQDLYSRLLKLKFNDGVNPQKPLTKDDILIVTPFNMQVACLEGLLGSDARIGTVDKFQGQEAPVVLISMVSSDSESVPRGYEFLFSPNRLNVAVSRAKCLAVVFACPKLLAAPCSTAKQIELVNHLCKYAERARWVDNGFGSFIASPR